MKKKIFLIVLVALLIVGTPTLVSAVNITGCTEISGMGSIDIDVKIANIIHTIITVIKIAVPVLLVIFGMLDLFKGITAQKEDEIKKGQQMFIKRLIAAALVFFVTSIVQLLVSVVADNNTIMECANCFINGADSTSGECNK